MAATPPWQCMALEIRQSSYTGRGITPTCKSIKAGTFGDQVCTYTEQISAHLVIFVGVPVSQLVENVDADD
jgi:hypothetical protein